jgi:signal transduction histidine kinase
MIPITRRMAILVTTAALLPLLVFGIVAQRTLTAGMEQSVRQGHAAIVAQAAETIDVYLQSTKRLVRSAAADLQASRQSRQQQAQVLSNHVGLTPEIRALTLYDEDGAAVATSVLSAQPVPPLEDRCTAALTMLPVDLDDDGLPRTRITLPRDDPAAPCLVAELRLEQLWRVVEAIRIGERGRAFVVDNTGRIIADGRDDGISRIAQRRRIDGHPLAAADGPADAEYEHEGVEVLAVASGPIADVDWRVIIEEPVADAFRPARQLERWLLLFASLALLGNVAIGISAGRSLLRPIQDLLAGIRAIGEGRLDQRVHITRDDEFRLLGDAFNATADRLGELQQEALRQERQAMFGRIAAGLVHDLSHPIQNINNNCKLVLQMHDDAEYRETFGRLVKREFSTIQRTFEDLRNLARPIPLEHFPLDAGRLVADVVERMQTQAAVAGVALVSGQPPPSTPTLIEGDLFALGRVLRNLVTNALQATPPGGQVWVEVLEAGNRVQLRVRDTGCGIPPDRMQAIFEDFVTTKRRGLGLGLAISKKIVEQLGGTITVESVVGAGSSFTLTFARHARAAAG